jgi:hypothetical protein
MDAREQSIVEQAEKLREDIDFASRLVAEAGTLENEMSGRSEFG